MTPPHLTPGAEKLLLCLSAHWRLVADDGRLLLLPPPQLADRPLAVPQADADELEDARLVMAIDGPPARLVLTPAAWTLAGRVAKRLTGQTRVRVVQAERTQGGSR